MTAAGLGLVQHHEAGRHVGLERHEVQQPLAQRVQGLDLALDEAALREELTALEGEAPDGATLRRARRLFARAVGPARWPRTARGAAAARTARAGSRS
jgi:hypothetical protein